MYTLAIKTQNEECIKFLNKSFTFEKQYYCNEEESEVFELTFNHGNMANFSKKEFTTILENFEDTDVYVCEQEQKNGESFTDYESGERFY